MARHKLLDKTSLAVIDALHCNARQSNTQIARRLGVSEASVRRRLAHLISEDVVALTAIPNPQRLGYNAVALIGVNAPLHKMDRVAEALAALPEVRFVAITTGRYDIFAWATFKSLDELDSFLCNNLGRISGVTRAETFINLEIKKQLLA